MIGFALKSVIWLYFAGLTSNGSPHFPAAARRYFAEYPEKFITERNGKF